MSGQRRHREPPDVSRPNHHIKCYLTFSRTRCKSRPVEEIAEIQAPARGAETKRIRALLTLGFEPYLPGRREIARIGKHDYPAS